MKYDKNWEFETICTKELNAFKSGDAHILPINATSSFSYENIEDSIDAFTGKKQRYVYSRFGNPTISAVQNKLALLEGFGLKEKPFCIMCNSGLAAIATLSLTMLKAGDEIITQGNLYGGTTEIFNKMLSKNGIKVHFENLENLDNVETVIQNNPKIKLLYFESPSNPTISCLQIQQIVDIANSFGIKTAIDNTFATPYLQRPFSLGVDYIVHSTTKFINGHGNSIAGAILGMDHEMKKNVWTSMKLLGSNTNAWDAWLIHNGIKTLPLRMDRHCSNAIELATYLQNHRKIKRVNYPGLESSPYHQIAKLQMKKFGAMLSFEIDGGIDEAKRFMNTTKLCTISSTLGNIDTLLLHPATSSHLNVDKDIREQFNISDGLIRVSVGLERIDDIIEDMDQALKEL